MTKNNLCTEGKWVKKEVIFSVEHFLLFTLISAAFISTIAINATNINVNPCLVSC